MKKYTILIAVITVLSLTKLLFALPINYSLSYTIGSNSTIYESKNIGYTQGFSNPYYSTPFQDSLVKNSNDYQVIDAIEAYDTSLYAQVTSFANANATSGIDWAKSIASVSMLSTSYQHASKLRINFDYETLISNPQNTVAVYSVYLFDYDLQSVVGGELRNFYTTEHSYATYEFTLDPMKTYACLITAHIFNSISESTTPTTAEIRLDHISVKPIYSTVPEPNSLSLFVISSLLIMLFYKYFVKHSGNRENR